MTIELRKLLREEQMTKHRNLVLNDNDETEVEFNLDFEMTLDSIKRGNYNKIVKMHMKFCSN